MNNNLTVEDIKPLLNAKGKAYLPAVVRTTSFELYKGKPRMNMLMEVETGDMAGKTAFCELWFTPAAMENSMEKIKKAFGYAGTLREVNRADFTGQKCSLQVEIDEYNGAKKVRAQLSGGGGTHIKDDDWLEFLNDNGLADHGAPKPSAASSPTAKSGGEDDLPF